MKIELWVIGKTDMDYIKEGIAQYEKRLKHYTAFDIYVFPDIKTPLSMEQLKVKEGDLILGKLQKEDVFILLDERGKQYTSLDFSAFLAQKQVNSTKKLIFQIGGAFGYSEAVYQRANGQMSLSKMTFSHQMIRLFFVEQLYRAFTILRGEKYHNE
jgi:23S rRNA (pseudouridine1915-N3)-methyltransferase